MEKKFVRSYARIPSYDALTVASQEALSETDRYLRYMSAAAAASFFPDALPSSGDRGFWGHLEHDLSFAFDPPGSDDDAGQVQAVRRERLVAIESLGDFREVMSQTETDTYIRFLQRCCERFSLPQDIRSGDVRTSLDRGGYVVFPPADALRLRMAELFDFLCAQPDDSPLFRAIVAMVLMTNAHPFVDGNGRLSRLMFQLTLWNYGVSTDFYFPWTVFFRRSKGGILLRVRQAEIHGNWNELFLSVCQGIANTAARSRSEELRNDR